MSSYGKIETVVKTNTPTTFTETVEFQQEVKFTGTQTGADVLATQGFVASSITEAQVGTFVLHASVAVVATANIPTLSGLLVIDGYQTVAGDRVCAPLQTNQTASLVYVASATGWTIATDFAAGKKLDGILCPILNGSKKGGNAYVTGTGIVSGTSNVVWSFNVAPAVNVQAPLVETNGSGGETVIGLDLSENVVTTYTTTASLAFPSINPLVRPLYLLNISSPTTFTLPTASAGNNNRAFEVVNIGTAVATLTGNFVGGLTLITIPPKAAGDLPYGYTIKSDGSSLLVGL